MNPVINLLIESNFNFIGIGTTVEMYLFFLNNAMEMLMFRRFSSNTAFSQY